MRIPVPNNKLVAFTLVGALMTALVAGALAIPIVDLTQTETADETTGVSDTDVSQQAAADAPSPNQNFTPAVQTQSGYEEHEDEEYEDDEEEYEDDEEDDEHEGDEDDEEDEGDEESDEHEDDEEEYEEDDEHEGDER